MTATGAEATTSVPLGAGRWSLWRSMAVRGAGFPVADLLALGDPECRVAADAVTATAADDPVPKGVKRERSARKKLGHPDHWDLVDWAVRNRIVSEPPPRHWYERALVRGTLAGGGLIGLGWTIFQIWRTFFER